MAVNIGNQNHILMQKNYKLFIISCLLLFTATSFASTPDSVIWSNGVTYVNFCPSENSLVVSSMEWFRYVTVYNIENGNEVERVNVRKAARKQTSQLVFIPYGEWGVGEYVIILESRNALKEVRLYIRKDNAVLVE